MHTQEDCELECILLHLSQTIPKVQPKQKDSKKQKKTGSTCRSGARDGRATEQSGAKIPGRRPTLTLLVSTDTS